MSSVNFYFQAKHFRKCLLVYSLFHLRTSIVITKSVFYYCFAYRGDEIGWYDMPVSIEYILKTTGHKRLSFVGNSFGCTVFFIAMIVRPDLNAKVDIMFAFAPLVTMSDMRVPFVRTFAPFWDIVHVRMFI